MWWKVDVLMFARQLVPPVLRSAVMTGWLRGLTAGLRDIVVRFNARRTERLQHVRVSPQAGVIEWVLNAHFCLETIPPVIRVESNEVKAVQHMWTNEEPQKLYLYEKSENVKTTAWLHKEEAPAAPTINVAVPKFLEGEKQRINKILTSHIAAGRRWRLEWFDY